MSYDPTDIYFSDNPTDSSRIVFKNVGSQMQKTITFNCVFSIWAGFTVDREYLLFNYGDASASAIYITYNINASNIITFKVYENNGGTFTIVTIGQTLTYSAVGGLHRYFVYFSFNVQPNPDVCFYYLREFGNASHSGLTGSLPNLTGFPNNTGGIGCVNGSVATSYTIGGITVYPLAYCSVNFMQIYDGHETSTTVIDAIYTLSVNANTAAINNLFTPASGAAFFWPINTQNAVYGANLDLGLQIDARGKTINTLTNSAHNPETAANTYTAGNQNYNNLPAFGVNTSTSTASIACLEESTRILTINGYKLISELTNKDKIISAEGIECNIINIYIYKTTKYNEEKLYIIPKDSIRENWPPEDVLLSACHKFLLEDNIFVLPWYYAGKNPLVRHYHEKEFITYYHIQLDDLTQDLVINGGFIVEGYLNYEPTEKYYIINNDGTYKKRPSVENISVLCDMNS